MKCILTFILALFCRAVAAQTAVVSGVVFDDANSNGVRDAGERGVGRVAVSNGREVVLTDRTGHYTLPDGGIIFPVKPAGYAFLPGSAPAYGTPRSGGPCDFALRKQALRKQFSVLVLGDPQMRGEGPLRSFREDILDELLGQKADLALVMGDVADNDLSIYEPYKALIAHLPFPVYHTFGNHDADPNATGIDDQSRTFCRNFGPDYYSFDEGDVHFVVLNNVFYGASNPDAAIAEPYAGGLGHRQFEWLANDLALVPMQKLVVLVSHIPFVREHCLSEHIARLFGLVEKRAHLLALSGHLHETANNLFGPQTLWNGEALFRNITVGATCGAWWTKPDDERGLPAATCMDGSPNGYFRLDFDGNRYDYRFVAAFCPEDFQMRITQDADRFIYANIFSASPETTVTIEWDGGDRQQMTRTPERDPFIAATLSLRKNFDDWTPRQGISTHLWKAPIPERLASGVHRVKITAVDSDGKYYSGHKLITR